MMDEQDLLQALRAPWPSERGHRLALDPARPGFRRSADPDGPDADRVTTIPRSARPSFGQRIRGDATTPTRGRSRTMFSATRLVATVAIVALAAGGLFLAAQRPPSPIPTPASPSPTAAPSARLGQGPVLTWTKLVLDPRSLKLPDPAHPADFVDRTTKRIAWVGDRFVLADEDAGAVSTSTDGTSWVVEEPDGQAQDYFEPLLLHETATWQDRLVGWNIPEAGPLGLRIARPPDEPIAKSFEGPVSAVGIGPAGLVVRTHSTLDFDVYLRSLLGDGSAEDITFEDGILRITTDDGRVLEVDWAAQGFEPGDVADRGLGWYSPDGEEWTPIPDFPDNAESIVGVSDGFILRGGGAMRHSPDGLAWREIGDLVWDYDVVGPWAGGALTVERYGERLDLWDSAGVRELPMSAEIPTRSSDDLSDVSVGPLGIVWFEPGEVLFSPDGIVWSIAALPDELVQGGDVAVGERSVLVLTWSAAVYSDDGEDRLVQEPVPSLWLGTVAP